MSRFWLLIRVAVTYLLLSAAANGDAPGSIAQSYWIDPGRTATPADARQADYQPFTGSLALGYSDAALWVRLRIPGGDPDGRLALIVQPAFLRHIELHDPLMSGPAPMIVSGRDAPIRADNHIGLDNGFVIATGRSSRDIYLRITTTTSLTVQIKIAPLDTAQRQSRLRIGIVTLYFAFLLGFALWGMVNWAVRRDALYGLFSLRQIYATLHVFVYFGHLRLLLSDTLSAPLRELIYACVGCTILAASGYFDLRLVSEYGASARLRRVIQALLVVSLFPLVILALGQHQLALQINSVNVNIVMVLSVVLAFTTRDLDGKHDSRMALRLIRIGFSLSALVVVVPVLMYLNILPGDVPILNILFLQAVISTIVLFSILALRGRQRDQMARETQLLVRFKEHKLAQESERRTEKERVLSKLTQELRNPLDMIRQVTQADSVSLSAVRKAVHDMTGVIERVEQSEKLEYGLPQVDRTSCDPVAIIRQIADEHGLTGRLRIELQHCGKILTDQTMFRSIFRNLLDNAARYSPSDSTISLDITHRVIDGVAGTCLTVTNQVGIAGAPDAGMIFSKYYRSPLAHHQPGSGLGLFLVENWSRLLGGRMTHANATRKDGTGEVTFALWLPG